MTEEPERSEEKRGTFRIGDHVVPARPIEPGLYIVATPIGNLGDITLRALETLASADVVVAEDTRTSRVLFDRYGISRRLYAYHEHNAEEAGARLLALLSQGKSVALISDAGTPLVSDPGFRLVRSAAESGIRVIPVPGASSTVTALSAAGLPSDSFHFAGFLPPKQKARRDRLSELASIPSTLILFEAPHRLPESLVDARDVLGYDRAGCVCRELTKSFEEFRRGTLGELAEWYEWHPGVKGEIVLLVGPPSPDAAPAGADLDALLAGLVASMPAAKAAAEAAKMTGLPRKELYQRLLVLKEGGS